LVIGYSLLIIDYSLFLFVSGLKGFGFLAPFSILRFPFSGFGFEEFRG